MLSAKIVKGLEEMFKENTVSTVKMLAKKYEFNEEEALLFLNMTEEVKVSVKEVKVKEVKVKEVKEKVVKEKKEGPKMVLPFCGRVVAEWCEGVKMNHGLYSQCVNEKSVGEASVGEASVGEEKYCKSCKKQAEGNESGKPNLGEISERLNMSSSAYREAKGKKCVVYAVVMKKLNIEKEAAVAEALKFGLEIPAEEFEMPKSQRGRPKKVSESDSVSSGSDEGEKKRRGRPKKNKTVAEKETDDTDDLIASLVAEANALKGAGAGASGAGASGAGASGAGASEDEASEDETENKNVLNAIAEKIKADETFNTLYSQVVPKAERKAHLAAIDEHLKTLLTGEEMELYQSASTDEEEAEASEAEASEAEAEEEDEEETVEASETVEARKAREAAEKKAQAELEKQQKKEQADLEKKAKKEQADLEKKAKADLEKKAKAEADLEKKAQAELEKKAKKEQADLEKKAKKEQADLEKKAKVDLEKQAKKPTEKKAAEKKPVEKKVAEKKMAQAEVKPVEKAATAELQVEVVEESNAATETVNAEVFEFEGKKYLKTTEGILYDQETEESVGVWNEETKSIDEFADDEE